MDDRQNELSEFGWDEWFELRAEGRTSAGVARVAAVDRDQLLLVDRNGHFRAKLPGSFLHRHHLSHDLPCVGDWVFVDKEPGDEFGMIRSLLDRRTSLRRKSAGNVIEYQMIAANVDYVIIVQSCHFDFNLNRLQRYLVMVADGGAEPCILLTKTDLVDPDVVARQVAEIEAAGISAPVFTLSNVTRDGIDDLRRLLMPGKTYCFVGSSGVGKSTLINHLTGGHELATAPVSGTGEGRHTTVRRQLIRLDGGALVIDNPGMREFGILGADEGIASTYSDISALSSRCRYRDCRHTGEPGCVVREALEVGEIGPDALETFLDLRQESEFNDMSYAEKRKKDRDFGRYVNSTKKDLRRR